MRMYADNYKLNYDEDESYQDFQQSCPQIQSKKSIYKKINTTLDFDIPVNYCSYLLFEVSKRINEKLKTNCFQIEIDFYCMYDNQNFSLSISSKKGPLTKDNIIFELEKYLRKLNLNNPIISVDISIIGSIKKLKIVSKVPSKYSVFTSVNYNAPATDVYLGLVKLDLDTRH